jgi:hypothetical protein
MPLLFLSQHLGAAKDNPNMDIENLLRVTKVRAVVAMTRNPGRDLLDKVEWDIEEVSWNRSKRTRRGGV